MCLRRSFALIQSFCFSFGVDKLTHEIAYLNESEEFLGCFGDVGRTGDPKWGTIVWERCHMAFSAFGGVRYRDIYCMCVWILFTSITCQSGNQYVRLASNATDLFMYHYFYLLGFSIKYDDWNFNRRFFYFKSVIYELFSRVYFR